MPMHASYITLATMVTCVRIFLVPFIIASMVYGWWTSACILFFVAAFTDVLDGILARSMQEKTFLGACLDPVADKLLILSVFGTLAFVPTPLFTLPSWFFVIIFLRELIILGGSAIIYGVYDNLRVQPTKLGKLTTFVEVMFIMWVFACYFYLWMPIRTYYGMLGIMLVMALASLIQYGHLGINLCRSRKSL